MGGVHDFESCYLAVASRDRRFEGRFVVAVTSTGVYCRVGCPSRTPRRENVRFFASAQGAEAAGFRPCRRCRPDQSAVPGAAFVGGALRLLAAGAADAGGVEAAARRLGVSSRTLRRRVGGAVGASPIQVAQSRRLQAARVLITQSTMPLVDVAFASGFDSLRRFNEVVRRELGATPSALRDGHRPEARPRFDGPHSDGPAPEDGGATAGFDAPAPEGGAGGWLTLRLRRCDPYAAAPLLAFLAARALALVESASPAGYSRALRTPGGMAVVRLAAEDGHVSLSVALDQLADLGDVVVRCRRLLDLDADPQVIADGLGRDPLLRPLLAGMPGLRVPGSAEPFEAAVRAVLGQQVSVAAARTLATRLVARHGDVLAAPAGGVTHLFPSPERLAEADLDGLGLTGRRIASIRALSRAVVAGAVDLSCRDPAGLEEALRRLPGFGPWTRAYIAMRAGGDPDAIPLSDLGLRRAMEALGQPADLRSIAARAEGWRPWRAYAAIHLWTSLASGSPGAALTAGTSVPIAQETTP